MKMSKIHLSLITEIKINIGILILVLIGMLFSLSYPENNNNHIKDFNLSIILFTFVPILIILMTNKKKYKNHKIEMINYVLTNTNFLFLLLSLLSIFGWIMKSNYKLEDLYIYNSMFQIVMFFGYIFKTINPENYMTTARSDILVKNSFYKKKGLDHKATALIDSKYVEENKTTVAHEAGHLLFLLPYLSESQNDFVASIVPDTSCKGFVSTDLFKKVETKEDLEKAMLFSLGGVIAEKKDKTVVEETGRISDMNRYHNYAMKYLANGFLKEYVFIKELSNENNEYSKEISKINEHNILKLKEKIFKEGESFFDKNKEVYEEIKNILVEKHFIYIEDMIDLKKKIKGA
tara:strand:- start:102241 stop:103284 length:1044 start_codon:yes stop_codon:yes gene_type:complete